MEETASFSETSETTARRHGRVNSALAEIPETIGDARWRFRGEKLVRRAPSSGSIRKPPQISGYRLVRKIAQGGMGEVWEAVQSSLDRTVAVKRVLTPGTSSDDALDSRERILADFRRESLLAARLEHPNILPVHDYDVDEAGNPLLVMKLVRGVLWATSIADDWSVLDTYSFLRKHLRVLIQVCHAVEFAHSRGVVHRDLKPTQVMVGEFGEVLLMDWGLSILTVPPEGLEFPENLFATRETAQNPAGTPAMMAPEQTLPDARSIGPWTDVYLLGGTLFYLLTGRFPHSAPATAAAMAQAARGAYEWPGPAQLDRPVPADLVHLVDRALAFDPEGRVSGAGEFAASLEAYLAAESRRIESSMLVTAALEAAANETDDSALADAETRLRDAAALWPRNPQVAPLRSRVAELRARLALERGDLVSAEVLIPQFQDSGREAEARREIGARRRAARRRAAHFRYALLACAVLSTVVATGAVAHAFQIRKREAESRLLNAKLGTERNRSAANADLAFEETRRANRAFESVIQRTAGRLDMRDPAQRALFEELVRDAEQTLLNEPLPQGTPGDIAAERGMLMINLSGVFARTTFPAEAVAFAERALELIEPARGPLAEDTLLAVQTVVMAATWNGDYEKADAARLDLAARLDQIEETVQADFQLAGANAQFHQMNHRLVEGRAELERAIRLGAELPDLPRGAIAGAYFQLISFELGLGNPVGALDAADRGIALLEAAGETSSSLYESLRRARADALISLGRLDEAEEVLVQSIEEVISVYGERHLNVAGLYHSLGKVSLARGDHQQALETLEKGVDIYLEFEGAGPDHAPGVLWDLARVHSVLGDIDSALRRLEQALALYEGRPEFDGRAAVIRDQIAALRAQAPKAE
ncbi:MAG: serine/threonine-protein kinase [Candidatus Sumerlaeia bacterium]|nr:serine/threonine-protein kinase [Candidatus Sumerlaeia bacterium]